MSATWSKTTPATFGEHWTDVIAETYALGSAVGEVTPSIRSGGSVPNAFVSAAMFGVAQLVCDCVGAGLNASTSGWSPARPSAFAVVSGVSDPSKSGPTATVVVTAWTAVRIAVSAVAYVGASFAVGAGVRTR